METIKALAKRVNSIPPFWLTSCSP